MSSDRFNLIDSEGQEVGFVVVRRLARFEHTTVNSGVSMDGPLIEAVLLVVSLFGFAGVVWLFGGPGWLSILVSVFFTVFLAAVRMWPSLSVEGDSSDSLTIKIEDWAGGNSVKFDEILDDSISVKDLKGVAVAVLDGCNFSRPALTREAKISQSSYHKISAEFIRLNFAHKKNGNRLVLSPRGYSFLRKVSLLG